MLIHKCSFHCPIQNATSLPCTRTEPRKPRSRFPSSGSEPKETARRRETPLGYACLCWIRGLFALQLKLNPWTLSASLVLSAGKRWIDYDHPCKGMLAQCRNATTELLSALLTDMSLAKRQYACRTGKHLTPPASPILESRLVAFPGICAARIVISRGWVVHVVWLPCRG